MTDLQFEWDDAKNASNQRKHGISFEEAAKVFFDPLHVSYRDRVVEGEERWQTFGMSQDALLMVAHTMELQKDAVEIRLISARKANRREWRTYEEDR